MYDFIYDAVIALKYLGIGLLMAVFPSESVMPFAGYRAAAGSLSLIGVIIVGTIGSTTGSTLLYAVARFSRRKEAGRFIAKYGGWLGLTDARMERAGRLFNAHARLTVFWGRFIPGVRSAVSIPAGYQRMPLPTFVFYTALGNGCCVTLLALLGYFVRTNVEQLQFIAGSVAGGLGVIVLLGVTLLILVRARKKQRP